MRLPFKVPIQLLQVLWVAGILVYLIFFGLSIQPMYDSFLSDGQQLFSTVLPRIGLTVTSYAVIFLFLNMSYLLAALTVALVIFWKRANDPMALLVALLLVASNIQFGRSATAFVSEYPTLIGMVSALRGLTSGLLLVFFFTFPDGQFVPRWSVWLLLPFAVLLYLLADIRAYMQGSITTVSAIGTISIALMGLVFQVYRYFRWSTIPQQQQTKWVLFGIVVALVPLLAFVIIDILITPYLLSDPMLRLVYRLMVNTLLIFAPLTGIPIAVGIAITRNRLWAIDLIINRSLVVAAMTTLLGLLFVGVITVVQALFGDQFAGLPLLTAGLTIGALFAPTRRRVQQFIDRRFYRWRFDLVQLAAAEQKQSGLVMGDWVGKTVDGYKIEGLIARGGMGEVYRAVKDKRTYAIKMVAKDASPDTIKRLQREAAAMSQLVHRNIVQFHGSGKGDTPYIALEYIDGVNLDTLIRQRGHFTPEDALFILKGIATALDYAHAQGVIHRDLKPANILLKIGQSSGTVAPMLVDFGLAKLTGASSMTGTGAIGTIAYMAPEQIESAKEVTEGTDIYALGVILYEMLTGKTPFNGHPGQVLFAHLQQPAPDPRDLNPDIPEAYSLAIMQAMAKDAANRWKTAGEMIESLADVG